MIPDTSGYIVMNFNQNMNNMNINIFDELNKYKIENIKLRMEINKLQQENYQLKQNLQISKQTITNYNYQIQNLKMKLINKEKELNDMKNKIINNSNIKKYVDYNKIVVINFMSGDGIINNIGIKCLKTDTFAEAEEKLYKTFSKYRESNNVFFHRGKVVLRFKTIEQNDIRDGDKVQLQNI